MRPRTHTHTHNERDRLEFETASVCDARIHRPTDTKYWLYDFFSLSSSMRARTNINTRIRVRMMIAYFWIDTVHIVMRAFELVCLRLPAPYYPSFTLLLWYLICSSIHRQVLCAPLQIAIEYVMVCRTQIRNWTHITNKQTKHSITYTRDTPTVPCYLRHRFLLKWVCKMHKYAYVFLCARFWVRIEMYTWNSCAAYNGSRSCDQQQ